MKNKKILLVSPRNLIDKPRQEINFGWVHDEEIKNSFIIEYWGKGYNDLTLSSMKKKVNEFKPDYIYCYNRSKIHKWMPDLTSIKVPKIMVELDTYKYSPLDTWYKQFDFLYCRQQNWDMKYSVPLTDREFMDFFKKANGDMGGIGDVARQLRRYRHRLSNGQKWNKVKLFRWSVKKKDLVDAGLRREGVRFIGSINYKFYCTRQKMFEMFMDKIDFIKETHKNRYKPMLRGSKALICPTESNFGDYVPAKIFEYAAAGAAIITNCNLVGFQMEDLDKVVIHYNELKDIESKLDIDFSEYHNKVREVMINHTHGIRYKEIFI